MSLDQNFIYMNFNQYYDEAKKALKEGEVKKAKKNFLKASEQLFKLAKMQNPGVLKDQWEKTANNILEKALELNIVGERNNQLSSSKIQKSSNAQAIKNEQEQKTEFLPSDSKNDVTFDDVVGLEDVKEYITLNVIKPFENPDVYEMFNKKAGGGVILYGPPGTGKTMIAKAIANEVNAAFFAIKASDIMSKWVGESEQNIKYLFESVKQHPLAVLFIDEIESLTAKRGSHNSSVLNRVVSEFLAQLDGFDSKSDNTTLILAATNLPQKIDPAIIRPGRFDRKIFIPLPNYDDRYILLNKLTFGLPIIDIDFDAIAISTENFSGADIKALVEECKLKAIKRTLENGETSEIITDDFIEVLAYLQPSTNDNDLQQYLEYKEQLWKK